MEKVFKVINKMYQKGLLKDYAIGGAVATIYYTEPFSTKDREKLIKLLDQAKIDKTFLSDVLKRHGLDKKFGDLMEKYFG